MDTRTEDLGDAGPAPSATPGERRFRLLAVGQITSMLGTHVSAVGVAIIAFVETGSVWWLSVLYLASRVPALVVGTHAGAVADRLDRRRVLLVADAAAGLATAVAAGLHLAGTLELWHLVVLALVGSVANAYQDPAFQAAVPTLVPPDRLDRANGLVQLGPAVGMLAGPALAGVLVAWSGVGAVLAFDLVTFAVAVGATLLVPFPSPAGDPAPRISTWATLRASWAYLDGPRRGLRRLVAASTAANLVLAMVNVLLWAILLPLVGESGAGLLLSGAGVAMLLSSSLVSAKGLPARRVPVIGWSFALVGLGLVLVGARPAVAVVALGLVITLGVVPVLGAASSALHHTIVEPAWQGRLAAFRRVVGEALVPVGVLVVAPLVESLAEPAMAVDGPLASTVGIILGVGEGRGVGLVTVGIGLVVGVLGVVVARDRVTNQLDDIAAAVTAAGGAGATPAASPAAPSLGAPAAPSTAAPSTAGSPAPSLAPTAAPAASPTAQRA